MHRLNLIPKEVARESKLRLAGMGITEIAALVYAKGGMVFGKRTKGFLPYRSLGGTSAAYNENLKEVVFL